RKPVPEWPAEVLRPTWIQPRQRGRRLAERKAERVRAVGLDPVDPDRGRAVGEDREGVDEGTHPDLRPSRRVAASFEVVTTRNQCERERDAHRRLFVVKPLEDVQYTRDENERDGYLPRSAPPPAETSREHDQRKPRRNDQRARQPRNGVRRNSFDQLHTTRDLGRHRRRDVEETGNGDEGGEQERRAPGRR